MRTSPAAPWRSILFAAGRGERLRPLTKAVPKPALPILDVPLAAWGLRGLEGFRPTVVNVSHLHESIAAAVGPRDGVDLFLEEPEPFGTGGTLAALRDGTDDTFICWNSDMLTDLAARALWDAHQRSGRVATIAVRPTETEADFDVSGNHATTLLDRRMTRRAGVQYMGAAVFSKDALDLLPDTRPLGLTVGLLQPLVERGELGVHVHEGYWIDVGTIARYFRASLDALNERAVPPPTAYPGEIIVAPAGRAYVGPKARVKEALLGEGAIVLAGAQVEDGSPIRNSIIWPNERVPADNPVTNSIWFRGRALPATSVSPRS